MKQMKVPGYVLFILCWLLASCEAHTAEPIEIQPAYNLTIVFPGASTEIAGGQSFRLTLILQDEDGEPVEGALVEAELWSPDGEQYRTLSCSDAKAGRYLANSTALPLRNSQGQWRIIGRAMLGNGVIGEAEGEFIGLRSYSERLQQDFGFWLDLTDLFPYNIANAEDPLLKTYSYGNGGYVILANNLTTGQINNSFVILDVHWRELAFPGDAAAAADYVLNLAGPHRISLDLSPADLAVEPGSLLGSQSWQVIGWWNPGNALGNPRPPAPLDWRIFQCPGSATVWTILVTTNEIEYLDDLRSIRDSFECPSE